MPDRRILVSDFINLKDRVRTEMLRRSGNGSVVEYGGDAYEYINTPVVGGHVSKEHANKNLVPLQAVNPTGLPEEISFLAMRSEVEAMETLITALETQPDYATGNNDCAAACTGMCVTACVSGCSTTCTGSCSGTCTGGCSGGCTSACGSGCSNTCTGTCSGVCGGDCSGSCMFTCTTTGGYGT